MRILIYTHGRTGSSNLLATLCNLYQIEGIPEPFNKNLYENVWKTEPPYQRGDPLPDDCIMKCITYQADGWIQRNAHEFDKIILLFRENFKETTISARNAIEHGWADKYIPTEGVDKIKLALTARHYWRLCDVMWHIGQNGVDSTIMWYEDIYSGDYDKTFNTIKNIKEDLTKDEFDTVWEQYLKPEHRYRQEN